MRAPMAPVPPSALPHGQDETVVAVRDLWKTFDSVVVTHSLDSAFRLADRLAVMEAGRLCAAGTPQEILASTVPFVRRFLDTRAIEVTHS